MRIERVVSQPRKWQRIDLRGVRVLAQPQHHFALAVVRVSLAQEMQQDGLADRVLQKSGGGFPAQEVGKDRLSDRVFRVLAQP